MLIARKAFRYRGHRVAPGEFVDATRRDRKILIAVGRAREMTDSDFDAPQAAEEPQITLTDPEPDPEPEPEVTPPEDRPRRTYRRRDLRAE